MTDGGVGLSYEQIAWQTLAREIEELLVRGFRGSIVLRCPGNGMVEAYDVNEKDIKPGERRVHERRVLPRDGEDRRQKLG